MRTPLRCGRDIRRGNTCDFHRFRAIRFTSRAGLESLLASLPVCHCAKGTPSGTSREACARRRFRNGVRLLQHVFDCQSASHASPFRHVPDSLRARVAPLPARPACARARLRGVFGWGLVHGYGFWFPVLGSWGIAL